MHSKAQIHKLTNGLWISDIYEPKAMKYIISSDDGTDSVVVESAKVYASTLSQFWAFESKIYAYFEDQQNESGDSSLNIWSY